MILGRALARPLCHFLGYLYPAYQSYKAVKLDDATQHTQWLTFWIVSTYLSLLEVLGDSLLFWLPFYYEAKVLLLGWLVLPYFRGATSVYNRLLSPYLYHYEKDIDQSVAKLKDSSAKQLSSFGQIGMRHIRSQSAELLRMGTAVLLQQQQEQKAATLDEDGMTSRNASLKRDSFRKERKEVESKFVEDPTRQYAENY